jgi:hypothetical protein
MWVIMSLVGGGVVKVRSQSPLSLGHDSAPFNSAVVITPCMSAGNLPACVRGFIIQY